MNIYLAGEGPENVKYKIDHSPDTAYQAIHLKLNFNKLQHLLITHPDFDHLDPFFLQVRESILSGTDNLPILHVYGSGETEAYLKKQIPDLDSCRMMVHRIDPFTWNEAGNLKFFSLLANHGYPSQTLNFIVQNGSIAVLIAWDTGIWREETWDAVSDFKFDCVFLECTVLGPKGKKLRPDHQDMESFLYMKERMHKMGGIDEATPFIAAHVGDNGLLSHEEAQALMDQHGVIVGFDGFLIDI